MWDAFILAGMVGAFLFETGIGTAAGGAVGLLASGLNPVFAIVGAAARFSIAVVQLRIRRTSGATLRAPTHDAKN